MQEVTDGVLVVDKPAGLSSFKVVERVKKVLGAAKAGHTGTLDPFATGVLPVCINQATKAAQFFLEDEKEYLAVMRLGVETDTQDLTGKPIAESHDIPADEDFIRGVGSSFVGTIEQRPPMFSAVKVKGKPLYKAARRGEKIEAPKRTVVIYELVVHKIDAAEVTFVVRCSKGAYIRTLAAEWGRKLGCYAHLSQLRRLRSGPFTLDQSVGWDDLHGDADREKLWGRVAPLNDALSHWPELVVDNMTAQTVRNGLQLRDVVRLRSLKLTANSKTRLVTEDRGLIAIMGPVLDPEDHEILGLKSLRVFNPS